ncbi:interleukin-22 receptor subunit alpha-2 [Syngnathoides biaculeatus]|uniref:interleukin-22 receptor subunit alpha-2 n=1 Tax=Syngnathoides biaculeatus TaxID=300417 RepID=UPI002ADE59C4|nr:interleukin-22 receptor subunit alpha-2 [Syngnathoides biaculeatus]
MLAARGSIDAVDEMKSLTTGTLLLLHLATCLTVPASSAPPTNVVFDSVDFKNVLRWTPPEKSNDARYDVQWKIYGDPEWRDADGCRGIRKLQCDLSGVTSDLREWYYARLRASSSSSRTSEWVLSPKFSPRWHTKISAPLLRLNVSDQGIVVHVRTPQPVAKKMERSRLGTNLIYKIFLINEVDKEEVFELLCCSGKLLVSKVKPKTKYCFQSQSVAELQGRSSARGPTKCITTL